MKIHETIIEEILNNRPFHDACEEAFKAAGHEIALPFKGTQVAASVRYIAVDGVIIAGDEWERKDRTGIWKPVGDSIGHMTSEYSNSNFRRKVV